MINCVGVQSFSFGFFPNESPNTKAKALDSNWGFGVQSFSFDFSRMSCLIPKLKLWTPTGVLEFKALALDFFLSRLIPKLKLWTPTGVLEFKALALIFCRMSCLIPKLKLWTPTGILDSNWGFGVQSFSFDFFNNEWHLRAFVLTVLAHIDQ
ncbi:hypothetical protein BGP_0324 [Beggiatoa sp. PS]|nr:hypothetical protein BGP_0324 [Beggiatoa sp. PS]